MKPIVPKVKSLKVKYGIIAMVPEKTEIPKI